MSRSYTTSKTYVNNHLLAGFTQDDTRLTPREVVHPPEGVQGKEEGEHGDGEDVEHHPADHVPLATENEHESLKTVHGSDENNGQRRDRCTSRSQVDEIADLRESNGSVKIADVFFQVLT